MWEQEGGQGLRVSRTVVLSPHLYSESPRAQVQPQRFGFHGCGWAQAVVGPPREFNVLRALPG